MRRLLALTFVSILPVLASADVWDVAPDDNGIATQNELVHGSDQLHDLAYITANDTDWFRIRQQPYSSYEVVVDGTSGDIGNTLSLDRLSAASTVVNSAPAEGSARSLRFANATSSTVDTQYIRAMKPSCTTACTATDVYRIRAYNTTYSIPRFNNVSPQGTVVVIQNPTDKIVQATLYFWDAFGTLLGQQPATIQPNASLIVTPASGGQSGAITVANDAPYGRLSGKAVSVDSTNKFSFDTMMTPIVH